MYIRKQDFAVCSPLIHQVLWAVALILKFVFSKIRCPSILQTVECRSTLSQYTVECRSALSQYSVECRSALSQYTVAPRCPSILYTLAPHCPSIMFSRVRSALSCSIMESVRVDPHCPMIMQSVYSHCPEILQTSHTVKYVQYCIRFVGTDCNFASA